MIALDHLPTEILSLIVEQVEGHKNKRTCSLINKRVYLAANPVLWRTLDVPDDASLLRVTVGLFLSQHFLGQHIRILDLHMRITNTTFLLLMKHVDNLDELNIHDGQLITDASFQYLPQHCPRLKSLLLSDASITRHSMHLLGQSYHQLRKLTLDCCLRLSPDTFSTLIDCPLEELVISGDDPSGTYGKHWLTVEQTTLDLTRFHLLTRLSLSDWSTPFFQNILTTSDPSGGTPWPHLTHLFIQEGIDIGDELLIPFIKSHSRLKTIYISHGNVTDTTLNIISLFLPDITEVELAMNPDITAHGLRRLVRHCPLLKYVNVESWTLLAMDFPELHRQHGYGFVNELHQPDIDRIRLAPYNDNNGAR